MVILPNLIYDEECPACVDDTSQVLAGLEELNLTDRFRQEQTDIGKYPDFRSVDYREEASHKSDNPCSSDGLGKLSPTSSVYSDVQSGEISPISPLLSPRHPWKYRRLSSPSIISPTWSTNSSDGEDSHLPSIHPKTWNDNRFSIPCGPPLQVYGVKVKAAHHQNNGGAKQYRHSSCAPGDAKKASTEKRCRYGSRRVLDQPFDLRRERLCFGHRLARTEEEMEEDCPRFFA